MDAAFDDRYVLRVIAVKYTMKKKCEATARTN